MTAGRNERLGRPDLPHHWARRQGTHVGGNTERSCTRADISPTTRLSRCWQREISQMRLRLHRQGRPASSRYLPFVQAISMCANGATEGQAAFGCVRDGSSQHLEDALCGARVFGSTEPASRSSAPRHATKCGRHLGSRSRVYDGGLNTRSQHRSCACACMSLTVVVVVMFGLLHAEHSRHSCLAASRHGGRLDVYRQSPPRVLVVQRRRVNRKG